MCKVRGRQCCPDCSGRSKFADLLSALHPSWYRRAHGYFFASKLRDSTGVTLSESELYRSTQPAEQNSLQWRQEVASRVRAHRARRRRLDPDAIMDLQFDPPSQVNTSQIFSEYQSSALESPAEPQSSAIWEPQAGEANFVAGGGAAGGERKTPHEDQREDLVRSGRRGGGEDFIVQPIISV